MLPIESGENQSRQSELKCAPERSRVCQIKPWLIISGIILVGGGITLALMGRNVIKVDLNGLNNLAIGLGIGTTIAGIGLITLSQAILTQNSKKQEVDLRVVSFNVGTFNDWSTLVEREELKKRGFDLSPKISRAEANKEFNTVSVEREEVLEKAKVKMLKHFREIFTKFQPDIICLQEYFGNIRNDDQYQIIKRILDAEKFSITSGRDCCIAYKTQCFSNPIEMELEMDRPAKVITLTHIATGKKIKVASDHVQGFDGVQQKQQSSQRGLIGGIARSLNKSFVRFDRFRNKILQHDKETGKGDLKINATLKLIEDDGYDVSIVGLDANATSKASSPNPLQRLHPIRMRIFEWFGYSLDRLNKTPTILDGNDFQPRKYDYVVAKGANGIQINISEVIIRDINDEPLLQEPEKIMSDHLPVLAHVRFSV